MSLVIENKVTDCMTADCVNSPSARKILFTRNHQLLTVTGLILTGLLKTSQVTDSKHGGVGNDP